DLVSMNDKDEKAVEFDNLIYGLMLSQIEGTKSLTRFRNITISKANTLLKKTTIPAVKEKIPILKEVAEDEFWDEADILNFERIRKELRDLMKFAVEEAPKFVYTNLDDVELEDRKSTRLNSSHVKISYAVFCLKIKKC